MKKLSIYKKLVVVFLVFSCSVIVMSCGDKEIKYDEIQLNFEIKENQSETCCYTDEEVMLFSLGTRNGKAEGPLVNTNNIIVYDYKEQQVKNSYHIDSEAYITQILPYKEGILYVDYEGVFEDVKWDVVYLSDKGKSIIDSGECISYEHIPQLGILENKPIYLWNNRISGKWGINMVEDEKTNPIIDALSYTLGFPHLMSNGNQYCILVSKDSSTYGTLLIGDLEGIVTEYDLDMKIVSMAMTEKYLVCSKANDSLYPELLKINLKNGNIENEKMLTILYRMSEFAKDKCLIMKGDLSFAMLNIDNCEITELTLPEKTVGETVLYFYPISNEKSILMTVGTPDKYYLMTYS